MKIKLYFGGRKKKEKGKYYRGGYTICMYGIITMKYFILLMNDNLKIK
jgi:hypothetical protein